MQKFVNKWPAGTGLAISVMFFLPPALAPFDACFGRKSSHPRIQIGRSGESDIVVIGPCTAPSHADGFVHATLRPLLLLLKQRCAHDPSSRGLRTPRPPRFKTCV